MSDQGRHAQIDPKEFRHVLGHFPTGVVVATALHSDGDPVGMAVGSFTSVSLDPPLVAFLPDKSSTSFPRIRSAGSFCINVLSGDQEAVCRAFAARGADKYAGTSWTPASSGAPILDGVVAWIDCDIEQVLEAGDHYIVLGRVRELQAPGGTSPLLFFQGGYGRFTTSSQSAPAAPDLLSHLRVMDVARPWMESLSAELRVECLAVTVIEDEIVTLGSAGQSYGGEPPDRVGQRMPFVPPLCALFVAWAGPDALDAWLARLPSLPVEDTRRYAAMVDRVRDRGWSLALASRPQIAFELALEQLRVGSPSEEQSDGVREAARRLGVESHEPDDLADDRDHHVRNISAPVFDATGRVLLQLTLIGLPRSLRAVAVGAYRDRLVQTTRAITRVLGGVEPGPSAGHPVR